MPLSVGLRTSAQPTALVHDTTRFPLFVKGLVKADFARFDTDCNRSVQGTLNQMAGDIQHMLRFEAARLEDICSYRTGAWLADRPCTVKGQKDCIWPNKAMLALLSVHRR